MTSKMTIQQTEEMFLYVSQEVVKSEPYLTEIDNKIGDGDHGFGMAAGFQGVLDMLPAAENNSIEDVFKNVGNILLDTMGGASGVLFGTMFISGIVKRVPEKDLTLLALAEIFRKSLDALKARGKAQVGDKTMIDAFEPAVIALEKAADENLDLKEGLFLAAKAAEEGVQATKGMLARFGRAKYYGEDAIGLQDAGATSVGIIFRSMSDWIQKNL